MQNICEISISGLKNQDALSVMLFGYNADRQSFNKAFSDLGIKIYSVDDIKNLAELHNKGIDVKGFSNDRNEIVKRDILQYVLHSINLRHNSVSQCKQIKFIA